MSNEELSAAIQGTWNLIDKTMPMDARYKPLCEHLTALLNEQATRAKQGT